MLLFSSVDPSSVYPYNARPLEIGVELRVRLLLTGLSDKALIFGVIFHGNDQPIGS